MCTDFVLPTSRPTLVVTLYGSRMSAPRVTALDLSRGMLTKARTKPGADRVSFVIADCGAPLPLRDGIFERVVCALLADHVPSLDSLMHELAPICSHDGFIALTTVHPTMHLLGVRAPF